MNPIDNLIKGPLTSLFGLAMMIIAFYGWWQEGWTPWEAGSCAVIGFALLWMRDKIPGFIEQAWNVLLDKFRTKK